MCVVGVNPRTLGSNIPHFFRITVVRKKFYTAASSKESLHCGILDRMLPPTSTILANSRLVSFSIYAHNLYFLPSPFMLLQQGNSVTLYLVLLLGLALIEQY